MPDLKNSVSLDMTVMVLVEEALRELPLDLAAFYRAHSTDFQPTTKVHPDQSGVYLILVYPSEVNLHREAHVSFAHWSSITKQWSLMGSWSEFSGVPSEEFSGWAAIPASDDTFWSGFKPEHNPSNLYAYI